MRDYNVKSVIDRRALQSILDNDMDYKVKKLTSQYNGHGSYKYIVSPVQFDRVAVKEQLCEWRAWCWNTWGPSREILWALTADHELPWSWDTEHGNKRIYLKTDAELTLFQLKFNQ